MEFSIAIIPVSCDCLYRVYFFVCLSLNSGYSLLLPAQVWTKVGICYRISTPLNRIYLKIPSIICWKDTFSLPRQFGSVDSPVNAFSLVLSVNKTQGMLLCDWQHLYTLLAEILSRCYCDFYEYKPNMTTNGDIHNCSLYLNMCLSVVFCHEGKFIVIWWWTELGRRDGWWNCT